MTPYRASAPSEEAMAELVTVWGWTRAASGYWKAPLGYGLPSEYTLAFAYDVEASGLGAARRRCPRLPPTPPAPSTKE